MSRIRGFEKISKEQYEEDFNQSMNPPIYNELQLPKRSTAKSAGYDVFSPFNFILHPNDEVKLPTGIKAYMQDDEVVKAFPRSGHGFKYYIRLANTIGMVDCDYHNNKKNEGHIWVKLRNEGNKTLQIKKGDAICQLTFEKYLLADGDTFEGEERKGGFGSTDKISRGLRREVIKVEEGYK